MSTHSSILIFLLPFLLIDFIVGSDFNLEEQRSYPTPYVQQQSPNKSHNMCVEYDHIVGFPHDSHCEYRPADQVSSCECCARIDMNNNIESPEKFHTSTVPEQYRPFSCTELTNEEIEYAKNHLNETEEKKSKYLRRIKRFMDRELDVDSELDDIWLLAFLRARRFDFKQTCLLLRNGKESCETNREYFNQIDTEIVRRVIASKVIGFLPYRDAKGRALVQIIAENWNPYDLKAEDMIFGGLIALHTAAENPVNQVSGYVVILDCKGVYFAQFREIITWALFIINNLQHSIPLSIKEFHVVHTPTLVLQLWNFVKPFLSESVQERVIFYDSANWEILHDRIPPCILPEEVGGQLGPFSNDHWASTDISLIRDNFFDLMRKFLNE